MRNIAHFFAPYVAGAALKLQGSNRLYRQEALYVTRSAGSDDADVAQRRTFFENELDRVLKISVADWDWKTP